MAITAVNNDLELFLRFCEQNPQGVTEEELQRAGWSDKTQLMQNLNVLLGQQRLTLKQLAPGKFLYQASDPKMAGLDPQHMLVYQLVEKAGDRGTWSKSLKEDSKLPQHIITKITKDLMNRRLIKEVKSVHARNKKVFMLWDTVPSQDVSGGKFYHEGEFNSTWVESLREMCLKYMEDNAGKAVTLKDVHEYVMLKPQQSMPTEEDIATVMRSLDLDEDIYIIQTGSGETIYSQRNKGKTGLPFDMFAGRLPNLAGEDAEEPPGLVVPCLSCHLVGECHSGGRVCPERCEYLDRWMRGTGPQQDVRMNDW